MNATEIRLALKDRNLAEVARRICVTRSYISKFMSGQNMPTLERKLSEYLTKG